ncbi:MAG TPA: ExeM/NucH family extracellular endonuclease [Anaerolineae bacterium]|nr:ExeM/NucH family extracellular endonuclease [Anaerolineae bacterium]
MTTHRRSILGWLLAIALIVGLVPFGSPARPAQAAGTISLTTLGSPYTQDFNTLASSGTSSTTPLGWAFSETGTNANTTYTAGTGSSNTGDTYSFGATSSSERAFGGLLSGSLNPTIGASFTNNTGSTISSLAISYTGEMWRAGVANRGAADRLDFQLSTNATSLSTGTWVDHDNLDFNSPNINTTAGALNGNSAGNQTSITFTITGLSIPNGSSFWIRWTDFNISLADDGLAVDDFSLTPSMADSAPEVSDTFPDNGATDFPIDANLTVTFSEPVNVTSSWFELSCSVSGIVSTTFSGGPTTFTLDPGVSLVDGENCTLTVFANQVSDQDGNDPPDNMVMNFTVGFSPFDVCATSFTPIYVIQGDGLSTPIPGTVTTKGVVVGDFEGSTGLGGFYLQDATGDGNAATSDGIFVFTGSANLVSVGQVVRVTGFARERFNQTTINGSNSNSSAVPAANIVNCGSGSVTPTDVSMPFDNADFPERFEGMLVRFPQALVISEYFNYERFGEMVIALPLDGETRPFTATAIDEPSLPPPQPRTLANSLRRITLDDGLGISNPSNVRHPNGGNFALNNRFRGGDTVQNTVGVLGFDFGIYRIQPTGPADYTVVNPRPAAPEPVGGSLRVAAMNTLNFFLTLDYPTGNPLDNKCGPAQNVECRGADSDQPLEFTRQRDKLLAALAGLDADIIGLNELENTTGVDPLGDPTNGIVAGLNAMLGAGTYAYIDTGVIGTDAIRVGLIYKPSKVMPVGDFKILDSSVDPRFLDTKNRPVLAQTFEVLDTDARFTVAVNHLKSKGSDCIDVGDPDILDGQGNCNQTRKKAAQALVDWLATDPTGSGDADYLIIGDLNSYAKEDPIDAILAGPDDTLGTSDDYTNLIAQYVGTYAYSFVFDGQFGYLDHALASPTLAAQATGAAEWHINADEPDLLDYDTTFKPPAQEAIYEPNAYRSSDHDPVIVGLDLIGYNFTGFFQPVDNLPTLNTVKAGQAVPVKFSLSGDQGLNIFAAGYPRSERFTCASIDPLDSIEETVTAGSSSLSYDPTTDTYTYVWKTNKGWAGTCRQLIVTLNDGAIRRANFNFTR